MHPDWIESSSSTIYTQKKNENNNKHVSTFNSLI